ncbi:MAG: ATP-binding protein [Bacteroidota bacterium]|nr:ATP-binding protein [Bacteroidota bacterium]
MPAFRRLPRLLEVLQTAQEHCLRFMNPLARTEVLILDDRGFRSLESVQRRHLTELIEDWCNLKSTLVTSQYSVEDWHHRPHAGGCRLGSSTMPTDSRSQVSPCGRCLNSRKSQTGSPNDVHNSERVKVALFARN